MRIIDCSYEEHAGSILEIMNDAIINTTALYEYAILPPESMARWFESKREGGFPVLGAVDTAGVLLGFATYGTFRVRPAYKYTVEHSVYVDKNRRAAGVGFALMQRLVAIAIERQVHVVVGCIDASNRESIAFHEKLGFFHAGTVQQAGFKFGRWLDLAFYQLLLHTPENPVDG